ncbi:protein kinase [Streptomyces sp. NPDC058861]|uniref:protein kinase domain-containing protein n=1 Tax=Streptomyces sp. NPDC058861 TaxID=3346653 RepID=UPI0036B876E5
MLRPPRGNALVPQCAWSRPALVLGHAGLEDLMLGTTVAGRYRLKEAIGRGGMGTVWCAEDLHENHDVALKIIPVGQGDPVCEATFRREAQVAARLSHPNVVAIRDHGACDLDGHRVLFLAMDLVLGRPLNTLTGRPLPLPEVLTWAIQISQALEASHHRGIVHRDLKPSNILIDQAAGNTAKLCDFGIARLAEATHHTLTVTGVAIGTPAYMSPEQARGDTTLGAPSDLYSLGCLLHELLTGHVPFSGTGWQALSQHLNDEPVPLSALRPGAPRELEQLVLELLDKDPARRPTAAAARTRLNRLHAGLAAFADAPTATAPRHPPATVASTLPSGTPTSRHREPGARTSTMCTAGLTAAAITGALSLTTPLPTPGAAGLGASTGLLLAALYLLDPPQPPQPGRLRITTAALMTLLALTGVAALTVLATSVSLWANALAVSVLGGPTLVAGATVVRRLIEHTLHRTAWHGDLAATAGALQTTTVLLIAHHAGLPPLTLTAVAAVLWPATALLTTFLTPRRTRRVPRSSDRTGTELRRVTRPRSAVTST